MLGCYALLLVPSLGVTGLEPVKGRSYAGLSFEVWVILILNWHECMYSPSEN